MNKEMIKKYANLLVKQGLNIQKGEMLTISAPILAYDLVLEVTEQAYLVGASDVLVLWSDDKLSKLAFTYKSIESLSTVEQWKIDQRAHMLDKKTAYLGILSDDPENLKDIDVEKISASRRAGAKAFKAFRQSTSSNRTRWCLVAYPNAVWAKKMFPELDEKQGTEKLFDYIAKAIRLDSEDPIKAWQDHQVALSSRCKFLNESDIKTFHYKNSIGTDFTIDMPVGYRFCGGAEKGTLDGIYFNANMPSEEVFSSPDRMTANGTLVSSMPLVRNGSVIDKFKITFKDGRIVDYSAEQGLENLKSIIETDEGSHYLGEIALVGYNSPIQNLKALFYETLFDENASCHFAIGSCYSLCIEDGDKMTTEELLEKGLNDSDEHVDFMVGTSDLEITATTRSGEVLTIFKDGDWKI